MISFLLCRKTRLLSRNDLTIDWKILYRWAKLIFFNHDESYSLVSLPKSVQQCSTTRENEFRLEIWKIHFCIVFEVVDRIFLLQQHKKFSMNFVHVYVHLILSVVMWCIIGTFFFLFICRRNFIIKDLSKNSFRFWTEWLSSKFRLWLPEFLEIWESVCNHPGWEQVKTKVEFMSTIDSASRIWLIFSRMSLGVTLDTSIGSRGYLEWVMFPTTVSLFIRKSSIRFSLES